MINDRIHHLIKVMEMNPTSFSDSLEVSVTVIFNIIKGRRSKPSFELILKILKAYDKLNAELGDFIIPLWTKMNLLVTPV